MLTSKWQNFIVVLLRMCRVLHVKWALYATRHSRKNTRMSECVSVSESCILFISVDLKGKKWIYIALFL